MKMKNLLATVSCSLVLVFAGCQASNANSNRIQYDVESTDTTQTVSYDCIEYAEMSKVIQIKEASIKRIQDYFGLNSKQVAKMKNAKIQMTAQFVDTVGNTLPIVGYTEQNVITLLSGKFDEQWCTISITHELLHVLTNKGTSYGFKTEKMGDGINEGFTQLYTAEIMRGYYKELNYSPTDEELYELAPDYTACLLIAKQIEMVCGDMRQYYLKNDTNRLAEVLGTNSEKVIKCLDISSEDSYLWAQEEILANWKNDFNISTDKLKSLKDWICVKSSFIWDCIN